MKIGAHTYTSDSVVSNEIRTTYRENLTVLCAHKERRSNKTSELWHTVSIYHHKNRTKSAATNSRSNLLVLDCFIPCVDCPTSYEMKLFWLLFPRLNQILDRESINSLFFFRAVMPKWRYILLREGDWATMKVDDDWGRRRKTKIDFFHDVICELPLISTSQVSLGQLWRLKICRCQVC